LIKVNCTALPAGAAAILKLNPSTLRSRMEKLGVERSRDGIP
jgi:transcriptional regulator with GAF, ATPase, and Fis domain